MFCVRIILLILGWGQSCLATSKSILFSLGPRLGHVHASAGLLLFLVFCFISFVNFRNAHTSTRMCGYRWTSVRRPVWEHLFKFGFFVVTTISHYFILFVLERSHTITDNPCLVWVVQLLNSPPGGAHLHATTRSATAKQSHLGLLGLGLVLPRGNLGGHLLLWSSPRARPFSRTAAWAWLMVYWLCSRNASNMTFD